MPYRSPRFVDQQIEALERHIENRLAERAFDLEVSPSARQFLLEKGASQEYGARELKRTILRHLTQPLAAMPAADSIEPGALVRADPSPTRRSPHFNRPFRVTLLSIVCRRRPTIAPV